MSKYYFEIQTIMTKAMKKILAIDHQRLQVQSDREGFTIRESFFIVELGGVDYMTYGEIEAILEMDRKTVTALITRLQKRKIVEKEISTLDKRQFLITLTEKGQRAREELIAYGEHLISFALKDFTVNEEKAILKYFSKLLQTTVTAPSLEELKIRKE